MCIGYWGSVPAIFYFRFVVEFKKDRTDSKNNTEELKVGKFMSSSAN
jgi:hypothetical protein